MAANPPAAAAPAALAVIDEYNKAVDYIRDTAKWLIGVFAAVGAVLVAGTQVSRLGQLPADERFFVAVAAFAVGLLSVCLAIVFVLKVLTSGHTSLTLLAHEQTARPQSNLSQLLADTDLLDDYGHSVARLRQAADDAIAERAANATDPAPAAIARFNAANDVVAQTNQVKAVLIALARNELVRAEFDRWRLPTLACALVGASAIATFAWAANPPNPPPPAVQIPGHGTVALTDAGRGALRASLGADCVAQPVEVIVLGGSDGKFELVAIPNDRCSPAKFTLPDGGNVGVLTPRPPRPLPAQATAPAKP